MTDVRKQFVKFLTDLQVIITTRIRTLREGNVFSDICLSFCLFTGEVSCNGSPGHHMDLFKLVHLGTRPPPHTPHWDLPFNPHHMETSIYWQGGGRSSTDSVSCCSRPRKYDVLTWYFSVSPFVLVGFFSMIFI